MLVLVSKRSAIGLYQGTLLPNSGMSGARIVEGRPSRGRLDCCAKQ